MKHTCITAISCILMTNILVSSAHANAGKVLQVVMQVIAGAGAATSLANGAEAYAIEKEKLSVAERIKQQGVDPRDGAIFSTYFTLNNDASSVYWADMVSKPDIYMIVSIEGRGDYLIPKYVREYAGQPILENIITKKIEPGRRIIISILDEDWTSDAIWNSVLRTKVSFAVGANINVSEPINASIGTSGTIQLIDRQVTLDSPEFIAVAEFISPDTDESVWVADGVLRDGNNREVGRIQFSQIWKADPSVINTAEAEARSAGWSKVFWFGLAAVLILVFGKMLFTSNVIND